MNFSADSMDVCYNNKPVECVTPTRNFSGTGGVLTLLSFRLLSSYTQQKESNAQQSATLNLLFPNGTLFSTHAAFNIILCCKI